MYPETVIKLYEHFDRIAALLLATDWTIIFHVEACHGAFHESAEASVGRIVRDGKLSHAPYLRPPRGARHGVVDLREPVPVDTSDKAAAKSADVPRVEALVEDFNNR